MSTEQEQFQQASDAALEWLKKPQPPLFPDAPTVEQIIARREQPPAPQIVQTPFPVIPFPVSELPGSSGGGGGFPPPPSGSSGGGGGA